MKGKKGRTSLEIIHQRYSDGTEQQGTLLTLRVGEAVLIIDGSGVAIKVGCGVGSEDIGDGVLISDGSGVTGIGVGLQRINIDDQMNKIIALNYLTGVSDANGLK